MSTVQAALGPVRRWTSAGDVQSGVLAADEHRPTAVPVLDSVASPEVAFLLVAAGLLCLAARLARPALGWAGLVVGVGLLLAGGVALLALPVRVAGVLMLGLAAVSLGMEVLTLPGFGLHAAGGALGLILAGVYLSGQPPGAHPALVVPVALGVATGTFLAGRRSWRCVRDRPLDPSPRLVGRGTVVLTCSGGFGHAVVGGELWPLRAKSGQLHAGQTVRVADAAEHWLVVEPAPGLEIR